MEELKPKYRRVYIVHSVIRYFGRERIADNVIGVRRIFLKSKDAKTYLKEISDTGEFEIMVEWVQI